MRFLILFICLVSVYDIYCTVKYQDYIISFERNAIAKMLIAETPVTESIVNPYASRKHTFTFVKSVEADVSPLVAFKCLGLLAAAEIMGLAHRSNSKAGRVIIYTVATFQAALLYYLTVG